MSIFKFLPVLVLGLLLANCSAYERPAYAGSFVRPAPAYVEGPVHSVAYRDERVEHDGRGRPYCKHGIYDDGAGVCIVHDTNAADIARYAPPKHLDPRCHRDGQHYDEVVQGPGGITGVAHRTCHLL